MLYSSSEMLSVDFTEDVYGEKEKDPKLQKKTININCLKTASGLIVLSSTHDWRHASVVISEDQSIVTSFKAQLGSFCIDEGSFFLYKCGF